MSNQGKMDCGRRRLIVATAAVGGVGAVAALVPFVSSLLPSERAKAAGAPVEVDISKLEPEKDQQPAYAKNDTRSIKPELMVVVGICTHLGCSPSSKFKSGADEGMPGDWLGGFLCPCHGSTFDFAGRVYKSKPAPTNLEVPPHVYLSDTRIIIGEDKKGA